MRATVTRPYATTRPAAALGERQQQTFGHQLADDAPAARAECEPDRHFALAAQRADEHQIRYVDADDQQDGGDGDEQQKNRTPDQRIGALVVSGTAVALNCPPGAPSGIREIAWSTMAPSLRASTSAWFRGTPGFTRATTV